ncbi:sensor histidine kinase [Hydrogenophaga sp.]|uniref:sensor histidine kinase n=1 Tax=Hydrogenophaga sp. TaxID=1904254 RepID=UPI002FC819CD
MTFRQRAQEGGRWVRALLWSIWLLCAPAQALVLGEAEAYDLSTAFTYRLDDSGTLSVREVLSRHEAWRFRPLRQGAATPNFGYQSTTLWLKAELDVSAHAPDHWLMQVANPQLDRVEVFVVEPGGRLSRSVGGDELPFSARVVPHRHLVFPLVFNGTGPRTLVLRVQSSSSLQVPVTLLQPHALLSQDHRLYSLLSLYFGLLTGLFAYNLLLYVAVRDRVYLYYIAFVAAMGVAQLTTSGFGAQFLWPERPDWNSLALHLGYAACGLAAILFGRRFLHSADELPWLDRVLRGLLVCWAIYIVLRPWMDYKLAAHVLIAMVIATILPLMLAGWNRLTARRRGARYFLLAWALLMVCGIAESLISLGWLPANTLLAHPVMVGSAVEMLLLSFALADRIKADREAKDLALSMGLREQVKKQEAERQSIEKSRFLAAVSHDLRQPLFAMGLATESLHAREPRHDPTVMQMKSALGSANGLLDSIMTMARLETGSLRANMSDFSIQPLLDRVDLTFEPQAAAKGLRWVVTPSIACVHSDPLLLERMVNNLVSNAVRFTQSGGVVVSCRLSGACLLLQVWDTGAGIAPAHHETIFTEYFRGEPETESDNGVGLGLFIVKSCAAMLDIGLSLRSVPGRGSCFSLRIPLMRSQSASLARAVDLQPASLTERSV